MVQLENEYINCLFNLNLSNIGQINLLVSYLVISVFEINHSTPNEKKNSLPPAYIFTLPFTVKLKRKLII